MNGRERPEVTDRGGERRRECDMNGGEEAEFTAGNDGDDSGGGVQEASCDDRGWLPFMLRQSLIHVTASTEGEGAAYKSMSWSTSSRERAKLGRLDSEPPLLLREWPPETGRERGGGGNRGREGSREAGGRGGQQAKTAVRKGEGEAERREKQGGEEFTHFSRLNTFLKENSIQL